MRRVGYFWGTRVPRQVEWGNFSLVTDNNVDAVEMFGGTDVCTSFFIYPII